MLRRASFLAVTMIVVIGPGCGGPEAPVDGGGSDTGHEAPDAPGLDASGADAAAPSGVLIRAAEGGLVESTDGLFDIYVFPGALAEDTTITISRVADADVPADVAATNPISAVYSVEPDGLTFGGDGAWGHYHFATPPAGAITMVDGAPQYADLDAHARGAAGGSVESHAVISTSYDVTARTVDVVARLSHLSLQWAVGDAGAGYLRADLGADTHAVGAPWQVTEISTTFPRSYADDARQPLESAELGASGAGSVAIWRGPVSSSPDDDVMEAARAAFGIVQVENYFVSSRLGPPSSTGAAHFTWLPEGPFFVCTRPGGSQPSVGAQAHYGARHHVIHLSHHVDCVAPAADATVTRTTTARREGDVVVASDAPVTTAEVTSPPETTRAEVLGTSPYWARFVPLADPPVAGPATITAMNGAVTMTATRTPMGDYDEVLSDADSWDLGASTLWSESSGGSATIDPIDLGGFRFGPVEGLDTDVVLVTDPIAGEIEVRLTFPGEFVCTGESFRDVAISGVPPIVELGDGTRGYDAPVRAALDAVAAHCGVAPSEIESRPFQLEVGTSASAEIPLPMTRVRVRTGGATRIDSAALLATCPAGRTYCTDSCASTATDPLNCGGCGLTPPEVCDGLNNDCDANVDEGCPGSVGWRAIRAPFSPTYGGTSTVGTSAGTAAGAYFNPLIGLCGTHNADGSIRQLRSVLGTVLLRRDTSTMPYTYSLEVAEPVPGACEAGTGGGSSGGTPWAIRCPAGMIMDGISGQGTDNIGQLQLSCSRWGPTTDASGAWVIRRTEMGMSPLGGSGSGMPFGPWMMSDDPTSMNAGAIMEIHFRYTSGASGAVIQLEARGTSAYLY